VCYAILFSCLISTFLLQSSRIESYSKYLNCGVCMKKCVLFSIVLTVNFCHVSTIFCAVEDADTQRKEQKARIRRMPLLSLRDKVDLQACGMDRLPARVSPLNFDKYVKPFMLGALMRDRLIPVKLKGGKMLELYDPLVWQEVVAFVGTTIKRSDCTMESYNKAYKLFSTGSIRSAKFLTHKAREEYFVTSYQKDLRGHLIYTGDTVYKPRAIGSEIETRLFEVVLYGSTYSGGVNVPIQLVPDMEEKPGCRDVILARALRGESVGTWLNSLEKIQRQGEVCDLHDCA